MSRYRIVRVNRAAYGCPPVGTVCEMPGIDCGVTLEDLRDTDNECVTLRGPEGFFTIPRADVVEIVGEL